MALQRVGDWDKAAALLPGLAGRLAKATNMATLQIAHEMRKEVLEAFSREGTPGRPWKPLSPLTLALRKLRGQGGTKILQASLTLRNAIDVIKGPDGVFLGIKRSAKGKDGKSLVNIGMIQEFGATIRVTEKMRRYLMVMMKKAGHVPAKGKGGGALTIHIPARPFLGPIVEAWANDPDRVELELTTRIAKIMNGDLGQP